ncbi:MAG TPA: glycosyltransferase [Thermoanaerobaculia bacterium]
MRIVLFVHSLLSDWNHGNAHFLRGVATELLSRGHDVRVYEPHDAWSLQNLLAEERGKSALERFYEVYPGLWSTRYTLTPNPSPRGRGEKSQQKASSSEPEFLFPKVHPSPSGRNGPAEGRGGEGLDEALDGADLVVVHEWNDHDLVRRIGAHRRRGARYRLLFHDTHHRSVTAREQMAAYDLSGYDGVLAFGNVIRDLYLGEGWAERAWTWHEAADARVFHPVEGEPREGDLVWIGNWGDEERTAELHEFLIGPVRELGLKGRVHGVRYPEEGRRALAEAGLEYAGWLPNFEVPRTFARYAVTVHVPRRPYAEALPGIPTIRPFEALACGIPLVSAPWDDAEGLFTAGRDYLVARDGEEMKRCLRDLLHDPDMAGEIAGAGRRTILDRHTCAHRVDELLAIDRQLRGIALNSRIPMGAVMR